MYNVVRRCKLRINDLGPQLPSFVGAQNLIYLDARRVTKAKSSHNDPYVNH